MDIIKVREICYTKAKEFNMNLYCPIILNSRLTTTLGRVTYNEYNELEKIEFSKRYLETATDECIMNTILHELAHAFVFLETGEPHGHDQLFRSMCNKLGTKSTSAKGKVSYKEGQEPEIKSPKYTIICPGCGKIIGTRQRACKVTKYPIYYTSLCCGEIPNVIQNY